MRTFLWGCLVVSCVCPALAETPDPPLEDKRLAVSTLVREDIFAGWRTDDMERYERGEKNIDLLLEQRPASRAELLAWKGGTKVYRAICAAFPEVSSFGGRRGGDGGFHGTGQAVDAMISDSAAGWRLARWLRANASRLGVSEVIYSQKIWTVQRSGEGWRGMSSRGSATANHYDHVHVSVY